MCPTEKSSPYKALLQPLSAAGEQFSYFNIPALNPQKYDRLPFCVRVLLESAVRNCDNFQAPPGVLLPCRSSLYPGISVKKFPLTAPPFWSSNNSLRARRPGSQLSLAPSARPRGSAALVWDYHFGLVSQFRCLSSSLSL
ncbi:hypothetical protein FHG87_007700 [Trinorchestia longiramus]|nr:hypothetical protein FHG87_007700 [Trinorchestia longiramus]